MREPTQAELLAQLAAMQEQVAKLQAQLTAQPTGSGGLAQDGRVAAGEKGVAAGDNLHDNTITTGDHNVTGNENIGRCPMTNRNGWKYRPVNSGWAVGQI